MPRKSREHSATGIYHVMLRGINREDIFHEYSDYSKFIKILKVMTSPVQHANGDILPPACDIYAYCLMTNHVHLLIGENRDEIGAIMKKIGISYVGYYNKHYERQGPLFQDRFRSEPVQDVGYFVTLLRYIHQNPVEAQLVKGPGDYRWSSWHEYANATAGDDGICKMSVPFSGMTKEQLCEMVLKINVPSSGVVEPFDHHRLSDNEARAILQGLCPDNIGIDDIKAMNKYQRFILISKAVESGIGMNQLSRITGVAVSVIHRAAKARK